MRRVRYPGARALPGQVPARHASRPDIRGDQQAGFRPDRQRGHRLDQQPEARLAARPAPSAPPRLRPGPPDGGYPPPPTTLSLVISRKARREAAALAEAAARPDPRIEVIEHVLTGLHVAGNVFVFSLSVIGWLWLAVQQPTTADTAARAGTATGSVAQTTAPSGLASHAVLQPLVNASGATLVLVMLATCLLMAPVVNPFYAPPDERRLLHTTTTVLFGLLALSTVAVIAGAAR